MGRSGWISLAAALGFSCGAPALDPQDAHGHLTSDATWSGTVHLTGDVVVDEGVVLTLAPGTTVIVEAGVDKEAQSNLGPHDELTATDPAYTDAYERSHVTLLVNGELRAQGTREAPIVFRSSAATPHYADWVGLTLKQGALSHVIVEWSRDGVGTMDDHRGLVLEGSVVRHAWASCTNVQRPAAGAATRIEGSTLEDCGHEAIDSHAPGALTVVRTLIRGAQAGANLNGAMDATLENDLFVDTAQPLFLNSATGSVFATQLTLEAQLQDTARFTFEGFTLPQLQPDAAVSVAAEASAELVLTNAILFDSTFGVRSQSSAPLSNGYLNLDAVGTAFEGATEGAGVLRLDSGFVDRAGGDFHLRDDSPLKGVGNPADGQPDLGAYGGAAAPPVVGAEIG